MLIRKVWDICSTNESPLQSSKSGFQTYLIMIMRLSTDLTENSTADALSWKLGNPTLQAISFPKNSMQNTIKEASAHYPYMQTVTKIVIETPGGPSLGKMG